MKILFIIQSCSYVFRIQETSANIKSFQVCHTPGTNIMCVNYASINEQKRIQENIKIECSHLSTDYNTGLVSAIT